MMNIDWKSGDISLLVIFLRAKTGSPSFNSLTQPLAFWTISLEHCLLWILFKTSNPFWFCNLAQSPPEG